MRRALALALMVGVAVAPAGLATPAWGGQTAAAYPPPSDDEIERLEKEEFAREYYRQRAAGKNKLGAARAAKRKLAADRRARASGQPVEVTRAPEPVPAAAPVTDKKAAKRQREAEDDARKQAERDRKGEREAAKKAAKKAEREQAKADRAARKKEKQDGEVATTPTPTPDAIAPPIRVAAPTPVPVASPPGTVSPGMQYLYGSGEAAALSLQAYLGLIDLMVAKSSDRAVGQSVFSVVLTAGSNLGAPKYMPCGAKPLAVVFDVDETAILNLGFEADESQRSSPFDESRWEAWERTGSSAVVPTPGMVEAARVAKASKVTLVFNTNRSAANASATEAALEGAGLGPVRHLKNLWLQGDAGGGSGKDMRRQAISKQYCVIAMVGDQLGDFSDEFNRPGLTPAARRAMTQANSVKLMWGHGWFVLPNPVYGTGLKGKLDDIFPADKRWTMPDPPAN